MSCGQLPILVLISIWASGWVCAGNSGEDDLLQNFLSRLSQDEQSFWAFKIYGTGGPKEKRDYRFKTKGNHDVFESLPSEGERRSRTIKNPDYLAIIIEVDEGKWMLDKVVPAGTNDYERHLKHNNFLAVFFGTLMSRINVVEFVGMTSQPNGFLCEYRYPPDCPVYSEDALLNSFNVLFSDNTANARLLEIRHYEGSNENRIFSITKFEYPEASFFPLRRIGKGTVESGGMKGIEIVMEDFVEIDNENTFLIQETYLKHYGLPEPIFVSQGIFSNRWFLFLVMLVVLTVFLFYMRKNKFGNVQ